MRGHLSGQELPEANNRSIRMMYISKLGRTNSKKVCLELEVNFNLRRGVLANLIRISNKGMVSYRNISTNKISSLCQRYQKFMFKWNIFYWDTCRLGSGGSESMGNCRHGRYNFMSRHVILFARPRTPTRPFVGKTHCEWALSDQSKLFTFDCE